MDLLSRRKGEMLNMSPVEGGDSRMTNIEYVVPTRGMIGLRNSMLTATRGTAVMDTIFDSYKPYAGSLVYRIFRSCCAIQTFDTNSAFSLVNELCLPAKTRTIYPFFWRSLSLMQSSDVFYAFFQPESNATISSNTLFSFLLSQAILKPATRGLWLRTRTALRPHLASLELRAVAS